MLPRAMFDARRGPARAAGALAVALVAATGTVAVPAHAAPAVEWRACGDGLECADVAVPLDHDDPSAGSITVGLLRRPARDAARRQGTLFVNAGIQAGNGTAFVRHYGAKLAPLTETFDVVGFDLRGTGASRPVATCMTYEEERALEPPLAAVMTVADRDARVHEADVLTGACAERSGPLLRFMSTADAARDLDLLRQAVGEDRLTYLGLSYGTLVGQYYAALFPHRVGAMVLDGVVHAAAYAERPLHLDIEQFRAVEAALGEFFAWCARTPALCPFGNGDPAGAFDRLVAKLEANRRAEPDRHDLLTGGTAVVRMVGALVEPANWPAVARLLAFLDATPKPTTPLPSGPDLLTAAVLATTCSDRDMPTMLERHDAHLRTATEVSPHFGPVFGYGELKCARWPVAPAHRYQGPWGYTGDAPVLVVGTTGDPLTPYRWARHVAAELGNQPLLTLDGAGHMAFGRGSACLDAHVVAYLRAGTVPADGTTCRLPLPGAA